MALSSQDRNTSTEASAVDKPKQILVIVATTPDGEITKRVEVDLSLVEDAALRILPNSITMFRDLTPAESLERSSMRALLASPFGRKLRVSDEVAKSPEYKANSLLYVVREFVRGLLRETCKMPVSTLLEVIDDDAIRVMWYPDSHTTGVVDSAPTGI